MREIKFRAWDFQTNTWATEYDAKLSIGLRFGIDDWFDEGGMAEPKVRFHFMQFTGLKDKNGKEIYEGDILKHPIEKRWFPWVIEFHGASFCLVNIGIDGYKHEPMYLTEDRVSERETIGNIYENPELLKP